MKIYTTLLFFLVAFIVHGQDTIMSQSPGNKTIIIINEHNIIINDRVIDFEGMTEEELDDLEDELDDLEDEIEDIDIDIDFDIDEDGNVIVERDHDNDIEDEYEFDFPDVMKSTKKKNKKKLKNVTTRWFLLSLGMNSFIKDDMNPEIDGVDPTENKLWGSWNVGINVFTTRFNLIKHYVNLKVGLGTDFDYYKLSNDYVLKDKENNVNWVNHPEGAIVSDYDKNKLHTVNIKIPVLLNFETNPRKMSRSFHLNAGVYGGLVVYSNMKLEYGNKKLRIKDDFNINKLQYGLTGSIGYGGFNLYANYGLSEFFNDDENGGYVLNPITVGLQVTPF